MTPETASIGLEKISKAKNAEPKKWSFWIIQMFQKESF